MSEVTFYGDYRLVIVIIGFIVVLGSIAGGYSIHGGNFGILWQPSEYIIIGGAAIGSFMIGTPGPTRSLALKSLGLIFRGSRYHEKQYLELLCMLYMFFKIARVKGDMAMEPHVEKPGESTIFKQFPTITKNHEAMDFLTGYMRILTLGTNNANDMESIMDNEIDGYEHELHAASGSIQTMADGTPALGIVAAVLGVIVTMGSITEPPEVLGLLIGAALVGTFFGVLMAYGFLGPIASAMAGALNPEIEYLRVIKAGLIGHMQGYAPQISVEFARKTIGPEARPTFAKVDIACNNLTIPTG